MLEQPKKSGGKLVSHILASHGGDETEINLLLMTFSTAGSFSCL